MAQHTLVTGLAQPVPLKITGSAQQETHGTTSSRYAMPLFCRNHWLCLNVNIRRPAYGHRLPATCGLQTS